MLLAKIIPLQNHGGFFVKTKMSEDLITQLNL